MVGVMMLNSSIGAEAPATLVYYLDAAAQGAFPDASITTSASFDGSSQYLDIASTTAFGFGTADFTIECWWRPTANVRSDILDFWSTPSSNPGTRFDLGRITSTTLDLYTDGTGGSGAKITGPSIASLLNSWHHIAVTRQSGSIYMWVDGTQAGSTYSANVLDMGTGGMNLRIMGDHGASANGSGNLSNIRVVTGTALYTTTFTPPTATLRAVSGTALLLPLTAAPFMDLSTNLATVTNTGTVTTTASAPSLTAATTDVTGTYTLSSSNTSGRISWSTDQGGLFRNTFSGDGINAYITGGPDWSAATRSYTVFVAYKLTGTSNYGRLVNSNTFSPDFLIGGYSSKSKALYSDGGQVNLSGPVDTVWHLDWGRYNKKTTTGSLFSVTTAQPTSTPAYTATVSMNAFNQLKLFSKGDGNECAAGDIGVIRVWDGAMTTAQMQAEWAAFHTRFGY